MKTFHFMIWALAGLAASAASAQPVSGPQPPEANRRLAHDILRDLVEVRSVHEVGTADVAARIVARLKAAGFPDADVQAVADPKFPNQVNVVAPQGQGPRQTRPVGRP